MADGELSQSGLRQRVDAPAEEVAEDIAERKLAEEALAALNEELTSANEELSATNEELESAYAEIEKGQAELQESEERYRTVAECTYDWVYWLAPDGRLLFMSPSCERITGYRAEEFQQVPGLLKAITHPDDQSLLAEHLMQAANEQADADELVFRIITRDGNVRWIAHACQAARGRDGSYLGRRAGNRDITDSKLAEEALAVLNEELTAANEELSATNEELSATNEELESAYVELGKGQAELEEREQRFRATFEQAAVGIAHVDPDGHWLRVNQRFCDIVGYTREELHRLNFRDLTHPADLDADVEYHRQMVRGDIPTYTMEKRYLRKDASLVWISLTASMARTPAGEPEYFISVVQDITERKRAEIKLLQSERELPIRNRIANIFLTATEEQMYYDVLKILLETFDSEFGVFGFISERGDFVVPSMSRHIWDQCQVTEKTITFPREQWGDSIWPCAIRQQELLFSNEPSSRIPEGHIPIIRNISCPIIHRGKVVGLFQVANKASDYDETDIEMARIIADGIAPILDARLSRDREEAARKRAEEDIRQLNAELELRVKDRTAELQVTNKELESFAYSVSHDLRAPLRAVDGFSQALLEDYDDKLDETGRRYLNRVRNGAQRMAQLIDDVLVLSRVTRAELTKQDVDLSVYAQRIIAEQREREPARAVEVVIQPQMHAQADRRLMQQVLENFLNNAWKFTGKTPAASIEFGCTMQSTEPGQVNSDTPVYFVRDNGAGFDMEYIDKLFLPFQRLHQAVDFPGNGIGLATVQRIIVRHGGKVWAQGKVGEGATFYFTLG